MVEQLMPGAATRCDIGIPEPTTPFSTRELC
jgi:hypothetical protein